MTSWLNKVVINAARNGSTTHTINPASTATVVAGTAFTPTSGNLLICVCEGPVTSTTPSGWTLPTSGSAINSTGLYVWYKTASGSDTIATTHNASNYPLTFAFYEFPAGSTFQKSASATGAGLTSSSPSLTSLTGTYTGMAAIGEGTASSVPTTTWTSPATEDFDTGAAGTGGGGGTDGYTLTAAFQDGLTASSYAPASVTAAGGYGNMERLTWAVNVASGATNYNGTAAVAGTAATTTVGVVGKLIGATLAATVAITAGGVVGRSTGASVAEAATISAAGAVGVQPGSASLTATVTPASAGAVGTATGASVASSATLTATGVAGTATGAARAATGTITAAGVVSASTGSSLAATGTITAAGSVTAVGASSAAVAAVAAVTSTGGVGTRTGASSTATAAITTAGVVGKATGTSIPVSVTLTAAGTVTAGGTGSAAINASGVVTATGTIASSGSSAVTAAATLTAAGTIAAFTGATLPATGTITAAGTVAAGVTSTAAVTSHATITTTGLVVDHDTDRDITIGAKLTASPWDADLTASPWTADLTDSPWHAQTGDTMILGSIEYAHVTITADHDITGDTVEASFDERVTWHAMSHASGSVWRILVGPGQSVNPTGNCTVFTRITDSPEIPVMNAGRLHVTTA